MECRLLADIVAKVFLGWRRKILRAADAFYARRREGTISFHSKSITDLRSGIEKRRSSREVQRSTFARFLGLFDFRLLQQYLPKGDKGLVDEYFAKLGGFALSRETK